MMDLFTVGNLVTLGVTFFALFIVRHLDRQNRSVDLAREYGKRLKEEIAAFADEKAAEVKDNGLVLDNQKNIVKAALSQLNQANEELTKKADTIALRLEDVAKVGERIRDYDKSVEQLILLTNNVEDNLSRLRSESAFVDETSKRISAVKSQAENLDKTIENLELRFERENAAALEMAVERLVAGVKNSVDELQSTAKTAEQQVEEHRQAIDQIETERKFRLDQDVAIINRTLEDALERAAGKSNNFEEAALAKLREEALLRINRFEETVEEKFREYSENARGRITEIQELVKSCRNDWKTEHAEIEEKQRSFYEKITAEQQAFREHFAAEQQAYHEHFTAEQQGFRGRLTTEQQGFYGQLTLEQQDFREKFTTEQRALQERLTTEQQDFSEQFVAEQRNFRERFTEEQQGFREHLIEEQRNFRERLTGEQESFREQLTVEQRNFREQLAAEQQTYREIWQRMHDGLDQKQKEYREAWQQEIQELEQKQKEYRSAWQRDQEALDALSLSQRKQWEGAVAETEERLVRLNQELSAKAAAAEEQLLKEVQQRLEGYREGEAAQWKRLETIADDALKLDGQLRLAMDEAENRVRRDFSLFEEEQEQERKRISAAIVESTEIFKADMAALEQELNNLKNRAYDNVSEKLKVFEDDFFQDISRRTTDVDRRLAEYHSHLDQKLVSLSEETEEERRALELSYKDEMTTRIGEQSVRILSDLERLQLKASAFEEKIQNGMDETETRISGLSGNVEEVRRGLKDFTEQTRLFEKTDELKINLERSMETLKAELAGIEERRTEAARLETEFIKIRRLEDEINNKMTRFLTEKSHLELMEKDFERLIQTSQRVEERLREVTGADDTLQNIQVTLRKLEDAIAAAEEKFQRVESKNRILDETNRGIERNFQILEETELALRKCRENIDRADEELDSFRPTIEELAAASEKARVTGEKLESLDTNLSTIEDRIEKMQIAREWLVRAEARFEELNKKAKEELDLLEAVLKEDSKKSGSSKGAPPLSVQENVRKLARKGWKPEEIANALKIPRGEVELILDTSPRD